jgi:magnesium-transporting ATPase (P-type)
LTSAEAASRLIRDGPNAVRTHRVSALAVLGRQLRSALLVLPAATAALSFFLGDRTQAAIIGAILVASIALGSSMNIAPNVPLLHCIPASTTRPSCVATDNLPRSTSWIWWWVT